MSETAARRQEITVRQLTQNAEFVEAVKLQKTIWGFEDIDLLPVRLFVVASKVGGHVFGAYDGDKMVAFCLAIPGLKAGRKYYLHSHMLGVLDGYRDLGLGRRLKLAQRDEAMTRDIDLIEWTFDPLELKNAFFNIERLGAVIRRFVFNQYGTTSSSLHAGLPTDRCIPEWYINSSRVRNLLAGQPEPRPEIVARIDVPSNIGDIKRTDPARAREIQKSVSEQFDRYLSQGLAVVAFDRGESTGSYLFAPWENK
ncbi:MAG: acetyltransferase [Acidobacteria bacterium]|nr:acetyltransferase [Acidobacteriota bacterium]